MSNGFIFTMIIIGIIGLFLSMISATIKRSQEIDEKLRLKEAAYNECLEAFKDEHKCFEYMFSDWRG